MYIMKTLTTETYKTTRRAVTDPHFSVLMFSCGKTSDIWTDENIPDLSGRRVLVTGSNRGLGFATVLALARAGCEVVMTARTQERGDVAADKIRAAVPGAQLVVMKLDLSSLDSVRALAKRIIAECDGLNAIINNAGIAKTDKFARIETGDGLELVWQTNFYGPFLLTNLLMDLLVKTASASPNLPSRVVMISSVTHAHARNNIDPSVGLDRIGLKAKKSKKSYEYPATKLADLMFAMTLHRKIESNDNFRGKVLSICAHPGFSSTDMTGGLGAISNALFGMEPSQGCLSQVRACVDPEVGSGEYIGPEPNTLQTHILGPLLLSSTSPVHELYGYPTRNATQSDYSKDERIGDELWAAAEEATGAVFEI